jgi:uncharacterized protein YlaN (UPF0358 family)
MNTIEQTELDHEMLNQQLMGVEKQINPVTASLKEENENFKKLVLAQERIIKDLRNKLKSLQVNEKLQKELSAKWARGEIEN